MATMLLHQQPPPTAKDLRSFGLVVGGVAGPLFGLLLPYIWDFAFPMWPWIVLGSMWLLALAIPLALKPFHWVWMRIGAVLGFINTRIILGIMFVFVVVPMGVLVRVFRKADPMRRALDDDAQSYRVKKEPREKEHVERPF